MSRPLPSRCSLLAAVAAVTLGGAFAAARPLLAPPSAWAGVWTQLVCNANGLAAPIDGLVPTSTAPSATATNHCPATGSLIVAVTNTATIAAGLGAQWTYTAPAGSTIFGGQIKVTLFAPSGVAWLSTPLPNFDAADVLAACASGSPCGASVGGVLSATVPIIHPGGTHIYQSAVCAGACTAGGGATGLFAEADVASMAIELANSATPAAQAFGGALLSPGTVTGTQPLTLIASDPGGPGVLLAAATLDGKPAGSASVCAPVGVDAGHYPEYLSAQPCPVSTPVTVPVDTSKFPDGAHTLTVTVTDAANNSAVVFTRALTTANAPAAPPPAPAPVAVADPCAAAAPQTPALAFYARALGRGRLRFAGTLKAPSGCPLGTPTMRPLVLIEVHSGRHWSPVATARVSPAGGFRTTYGGGRRGSIGGRFTFRAVAPSTAKFTRVTSRTRRVRVR